MKITFNKTPKYGERFEGVYVSKTGVARRCPVALIQSARVQQQIKTVLADRGERE